MKITNIFPVPIQSISETSINIKQIGKFSYLIRGMKGLYYVKEIVLPYRIDKKKKYTVKNLRIKNVQSEELPTMLKYNAQFGGLDSFVVDMQGIHSFLYARSKVFSDKITRLILEKLGFLKCSTTCLRIGASGSPKNDMHPGGEVLEYSLIDNNGGGVSQTHSGFLPKGAIFSKSISLKDPKGKFLREERALYSHTAFLSMNKKKQSENLYLDLQVKAGKINILEELDFFIRARNIRAYSIQIIVSLRSNETSKDIIVGRVLKNLPRSAIKNLSQAAEIASEQSFELHPGQYALFFGTNYKRVYKDWEDFREGRPYEPYGHIHGGIITNEEKNDQHNIFHLRKLFLSPEVECKVIITPIHRILTIEPVKLEKGRIISKLNHAEVVLNHE